MPIRRSIDRYHEATPFEQAAWTLGFTGIAVLVPALLRSLLGGMSAEGRGSYGYPAAAARMAVDATAWLIQWIGIGILTGLAGLCVYLAVTYARGRAARSPGIPGWAVAETYAIGALAALAGVLWLM